ncbi:MAG: hypothetical protein JWN89_54 [Parcubacteria group bacterium]|nr:hypothetical protein [Parcubacteria group bacterium]
MKALKTLLLSLILTVLGFSAYNPMHAFAFAGSQSSNWSGYVATDGPYTAVNGSWTVPVVPPSNSHLVSAEWIGIGGINSTDLIQIGTEAISDNNYSRYVAWYEILPANPVTIPMAVHGGDSMTSSLNLIGQDLWRLTIKNNTTGEDYSTTLSYASTLSSAEWIEERPKDVDHFLTLTNFGRVDFTGSTAVQNGAFVPLRDTNAGAMTMIEGSRVLARATGFNADGQSFSVYQPENPTPLPIPTQTPVASVVQSSSQASARIITVVAAPQKVIVSPAAGVSMPNMQGSYVTYYTSAGTPIRLYTAAANSAVTKSIAKKKIAPLKKVIKKAVTKKVVAKK